MRYSEKRRRARSKSSVSKDWFAFRPPVTHATLNSEEVETAMAKDSVRYDVAAAARLQPWRRDQGRHPQPNLKRKRACLEG